VLKAGFRKRDRRPQGTLPLGCEQRELPLAAADAACRIQNATEQRISRSNLPAVDHFLHHPDTLLSSGLSPDTWMADYGDRHV